MQFRASETLFSSVNGKTSIRWSFLIKWKKNFPISQACYLRFHYSVISKNRLIYKENKLPVCLDSSAESAFKQVILDFST